MGRGWSPLSFLEAVRPEPGWKVEHAILTTYSADLVVVVATMLALSGLDDDRGSGSKIDFANAFEAARGRLRILVQGGRISVPYHTGPVLAIMDHFIREIHSDEREYSWHPKMGLVKYVSDGDGATQWRFWVSSRNMTQYPSQDVGFLMIGRSASPGAGEIGINKIGRSLAEFAELPNLDHLVIEQELDTVNWELPHGVELDDVIWMTPETEGRGLQRPKNNIQKLIIVSPFLDARTIRQLGGWGSDKDTERILVSTVNELSRLYGQSSRPLDAFGGDVLHYEMPEVEETDIKSSDLLSVVGDTDEDEQLDVFGLHAKLIYILHGNDQEIILGSANATQRAWTKNYEAVVRLRITPDVAQGVMELVDSARIFDPDAIGKITEPEEDEVRLESVRQELIARWGLTQIRTDRGPCLKAAELPPIPVDIHIEVSLLGCDLVSWPRSAKEVQLPPITSAQETELVHVRLMLGKLTCEWIQRAPLDPPPNQERDRYALARLLDARTFLSWIRSLLGEGGFDDGGGDWDQDTPPPKRSQGHADKILMMSTPTLEEILKSWSRDPDNLKRVDEKIQSYLDLIEHQDAGDDGDPYERQVLNEFRKTWDLVKQELVAEVSE